ncbi:Insulin-degrading enzyme-like [Actinidia chinensis var. chinensis]|uniref:Insulin-degrading enzyme-like n=1 Tax=Actinidia chinensis var. chinensis TaxID=1590841 RepID=A0A2R6QVA3_ACTCC|nr:Insulin-degrading enzyme-like [Actinidia chinensis var. chinensis]
MKTLFKGKEETVKIMKPLSDKREYRRIVLENSLQVLLISDPETDKCAAAMNVAVGYFSDPEGLHGISYLLGEMLYHAKEKCPSKKSFIEYVAEHVGTSSVKGHAQCSIFRFDVNSDCLEETLDRFARLFIEKPDMSPDAIMGAVKSVESEYQNNSVSDYTRMNQLHHHLSLESHPFHKFTGNAKTLEAMPKERIRDALLEFYEAYYSAHLMCLVVYAKENLDKIQGQVENNFLKIRNTNRPCPIFKDPPCEEKHLQILVKAVPLMQGHIMRILWPITPGVRYLREGPIMYLSYLIGNEGKGSLLYVLESLGWATWLCTAEQIWNYFSFFEVIIYMTDAGHEHGKDILKLLFKYIRLLQQSDPCKERFDEFSGFCEMAFHYQDKISPIDYVLKIATNMQLFPPDYWLAGTCLPSTFSPDIIQQILNELTPKNVR